MNKPEPAWKRMKVPSPLPVVFFAVAVLSVLGVARWWLGRRSDPLPDAPRAREPDALVFLRDVAPTLRARGCAGVECHGGARSALRLSPREPDARGAVEEFRAVVRLVRPGDARGSELYRRAIDRGHAGAAALDEGGCEAALVRDWIEGRAARRCAGR